MNQSRSLWEIRNEKNKANVRWVIILGLGVYLIYLLKKGVVLSGTNVATFNSTYVLSVLSFAVIFNAAITLLIYRSLQTGTIGVWVKYATMSSDFLLVALVLVPTGGS